MNVKYRDADGAIRGAQARVLDFDHPANNDWLPVNQLSVVENRHSRRPDVVLFANGLPLAVLEFKNAASENATIWSAYQQLETYKVEIPSLFTATAVLVISDDVEAQVGTLTAGKEWFKPWRTITGETPADAHLPELQVVTEGLLAPQRLLDLVRDFIVFEDDGSGRSRTGPRCPSTMRTGSPSWRSTRLSARASIPSSTRPPKARKSSARRSSRPSGRSSKRW